MKQHTSAGEAFTTDASSHQLALQGEVTFATVMSLLQSTREACRDWTQVVCSFQAVQRADSAALAFIMEWIHLARAEKRSVNFVHLPENLLAIISASRLDGLLDSFVAN